MRSTSLKFTIATGVIFFLITCGQEQEKKVKQEPDFKSEVILIDDQSVSYPNDTVAMVMEKAGMCKCDTAEARKTHFAPCDPNLFRYFQNHTGAIQEGFLVEVRPLIFGKSYRVINVVRDEEGAYKISNDCAGQLLEMRTTAKGRYDLVIRYIDLEVGTVAILHKWKNYHYEPSEVLEINDHYVKPEAKDSLYQVYIKHFPWGF